MSGHVGTCPLECRTRRTGGTVHARGTTRRYREHLSRMRLAFHRCAGSLSLSTWHAARSPPTCSSSARRAVRKCCGSRAVDYVYAHECGRLGIAVVGAALSLNQQAGVYRTKYCNNIFRSSKSRCRCYALSAYDVGATVLTRTTRFGGRTRANPSRAYGPRWKGAK